MFGTQWNTSPARHADPAILSSARAKIDSSSLLVRVAVVDGPSQPSSLGSRHRLANESVSDKEPDWFWNGMLCYQKVGGRYGKGSSIRSEAYLYCMLS